MAGTDAAKLSKVLGAAFQMALKLSYPGVSQLERHTVAAYLANGFGQTLGAEIEEQAIEVADLTRKGLTWQKIAYWPARSRQSLPSIRKRVKFSVSPIFSAKASQSSAIHQLPGRMPMPECRVSPLDNEAAHRGPEHLLPRKYTFLIYLSCWLKAFRQNFTYFVFTSKIKGFADTSALNARG